MRGIWSRLEGTWRCRCILCEHKAQGVPSTSRARRGLGLQFPLAAGGISSATKSWWLLLQFSAGAEAELVRVESLQTGVKGKLPCSVYLLRREGKEPCLISKRKSALSKINCCSLSKFAKQVKNVTVDIDLCPVSGRTQFDPVQKLCVLTV